MDTSRNLISSLVLCYVSQTLSIDGIFSRDAITWAMRKTYLLNLRRNHVRE